MSAKETERTGRGGAGSFVSDVKELRRRARSHIAGWPAMPWVGCIVMPLWNSDSIKLS